MENLDLRQILKDVPKGTKLYSPLYGECSLYKVGSMIELLDYNNKLVYLYYNGKYQLMYDGECMLFPSKENRDWNTFCPFKDGDILYVKTPNTEYIFIYKDNDQHNINDHVAYSKSGTLYLKPSYNCGLCNKRNILNIRLATEEEKEKLFDKLQEEGYFWNGETKSLEKYKFEVGHCITTTGEHKHVITQIKHNKYIVTTDDKYLKDEILCACQENFNFYQEKFDITTLKPYDKVLVRFSDSSAWEPQLFSYLDINLEHNSYKFVIVGLCSISQCIPYEGNEHLAGTTNDCNEYYKTW